MLVGRGERPDTRHTLGIGAEQIARNYWLPPQLALDDYLVQGGFDRHLRQLRIDLATAQSCVQRLVERHFPSGTRLTRPAGDSPPDRIGFASADG
jgi:hypothetical protein